LGIKSHRRIVQVHFQKVWCRWRWWDKLLRLS